jgi:hypothetical protein
MKETMKIMMIMIRREIIEENVERMKSVYHRMIEQNMDIASVN